MTQERVASRPTGTVAFPISLANDGASIHTKKITKNLIKIRNKISKQLIKSAKITTETVSKKIICKMNPARSQYRVLSGRYKQLLY